MGGHSRENRTGSARHRLPLCRTSGRAIEDHREILAPFVGSIAYYQAISLGLAAGVHPSDLKLVTGLFVLATLGLPVLRRRGQSPLADPKLRA